MMQTALVAGAAGLIGSALCRHLLAKDIAVIAVDNLLTGSEENLAELFVDARFEFVKADITRPLPVFEQSIDFVYHLASPASPEDFDPLAFEIIAVNTQGTWNLLELAHQKQAKLLFASTSEVYGSPAIHPQVESYWGNVNPNGPRSCYDESKRLGETIVLNHARLKGTQTVISRIFNTYGPRMRARDGRVVPQFLLNALQNEPMHLHGGGQQTRSFCYVDDLVRGMIGLMESDKTCAQIFNLGNPGEFTVEELAQAICQVAGRDVPLHKVDSPRLDDPERRCPDISKIKETIGWEPHIQLLEGLKYTWQDFQSRFGDTVGV